MSKLTKEKIDNIEALAETILAQAYGNTEKPKPPINLKKVLDEHGLKVKEINFEEREIAGAYNKNKGIIYVAANDYFPRQLFTIAHELGHFFLHKNKEDEVFLRIDLIKVGENHDAKDISETEADWFAASILMPRSLVKNYWDLLQDPQQLANIFGVSLNAMRWRLKNLNLLDYSDGK